MMDKRFVLGLLVAASVFALAAGQGYNVQLVTFSGGNSGRIEASPDSYAYYGPNSARLWREFLVNDDQVTIYNREGRQVGQRALSALTSGQDELSGHFKLLSSAFEQLNNPSYETFEMVAEVSEPRANSSMERMFGATMGLYRAKSGDYVVAMGRPGSPVAATSVNSDGRLQVSSLRVELDDKSNSNDDGSVVPSDDFGPNPYPRPRPPFPGPFGPHGGPFGPFGGPHGPHGPHGGPFGPHGGPFGPRGGPFGPRGGPFGPRGGPFGPRGGPFGPHGPHGGPFGPFPRPPRPFDWDQQQFDSQDDMVPADDDSQSNNNDNNSNNQQQQQFRRQQQQQRFERRFESSQFGYPNGQFGRQQQQQQSRSQFRSMRY